MADAAKMEEARVAALAAHEAQVNYYRAEGARAAREKKERRRDEVVARVSAAGGDAATPGYWAGVGRVVAGEPATRPSRRG